MRGEPVGGCASEEFDFDAIVDRRGTASQKWEKYKDRDVIPLWVADMDFVSPRAVVDALRDQVDHGVFGYTLPPPELAEAVLAYLASRYNWTISPDWLVWLPGLVTGLNVCSRMIGRPGDQVMTATPIYPAFMTAPVNQQRELVKVPLVLDGERWVFDYDAITERISPTTGLFLLCSPHNPVGRVFTREELVRLAEICERHGMIICSDDIHCDLVLDADKPHLPLAAIAPEIAERTITLMAPSKTFNIPGLGCSFAVIANAGLRTQFRRAMAGIVPDVNLFGLTAAVAAYHHGGPWLRAVIEYLRGNRDLVTAAVEALPGFRTTHVEATYLAWIDARSSGLDDPAGFFEQAGVGLSNGRDFDGPGFLRLNFGCSRRLLEQALERMRGALLER